MRIITKPSISPLRTYVRCYSSYRIAAKNNFRAIAKFIDIQSLDYDRRANNKNLYTFSVHTHVHGHISKNEMVKLYNDKMVKHPTGRKIYDKLMGLAPLDRCPFCGIGRVKTLDHYLPETKFPTFSVLPYNLVASCRDCNIGKSTHFASTQNTQTIHPYYDDYTHEQWLYAKVLESIPVSIEFYVNPPSHWDQVDKDRVQEHFKSYELAERFSIEASNALADLREEFILYKSSPSIIQKELKKKAKVYESRYKNSFETAMYQALYKSQWYCNGGYA
ncbi:HNH endonuclease [Sulfurimonas indica]|uniref:HNH endonuclease n=1 Tax=Sulfurimonas indica TaxID=2508707 RepID=UPI001265424E|nr:hypothetical protein [Sulfurimonas indica]